MLAGLASVIVLTSLSVPRVQLTTNSDSTAKFRIEKCVRANLFNEFLPGIVKKRPEIMVLRGSYINKIERAFQSLRLRLRL